MKITSVLMDIVARAWSWLARLEARSIKKACAS